MHAIKKINKKHVKRELETKRLPHFPNVLFPWKGSEANTNYRVEQKNKKETTVSRNNHIKSWTRANSVTARGIRKSLRFTCSQPSDKKLEDFWRKEGDGQWSRTATQSNNGYNASKK